MAPRQPARGLVLDLPDKLRPQERSIQAAVEAALAEFHAGKRDPAAARKRKLWAAVGKWAASKQAKRFCEIARELGVDPLAPDPGWLDGDAPEAAWLLRCAAYLEQAPEIARAYVALYRPEEWRYRRLFRIWTEAWAKVETKADNEGKLSDSSSGPLIDFMQSACPELDGETIRKAAQREKARRRIHATASGGHVVRHEIPLAVLEAELERRKREDAASD